MAYINGNEIFFSPRIGSGLTAEELQGIFATKEELAANYVSKSELERFGVVYDYTSDSSEDIEKYAPRKFEEYCLDGSNGTGRIIYFNYNGAHYWALGYYTQPYGKFLLMQYGTYGIKVFDCYAGVWTVTKLA